MKMKIVGIIVCTLVIATAVPAVVSVKNNMITQTNPSIPQQVTAGNWSETQKLLASDGVGGDSFGISVSIYGDTALIGAYVADSAKGAAYVFTRNGSSWSQQAKLTASDGATNDQFGWPVSLYGDTALIGAVLDDDKGTDSGSVYVFTRTGTTWNQQAKLTASNGESNDQFGVVSLYGDTALVGAPLHNTNKGTAYVFTRSGSTWTQQAELNASDAALGDQFGVHISISGESVLIGAIGDEGFKGSAYVFTRTGTTWTQEAKLVAPDGDTGDSFGIGGSLNGDTALIGANYADNVGPDSGEAYVFTRSGTTWTLQTIFTPIVSGVRLGFSVALSGNIALTGATGFNNDKGVVYTWTRNGSTWDQGDTLMASDGQSGDYFGNSVSLSGGTALIGAPFNFNQGAAYIFTRQNQPPVTPPAPNGPDTGIIHATYSFTAVTTDPNDDDVFYLFDWGDGTNSSWVGPYTSGATATATHAWTAAGTYLVKVKAKDVYGAETDWSPTHTITILAQAPSLAFEQFKGGMGVGVVVKNVGNATATNIVWNIILDGKMVFHGKQTDGTISTLAPAATQNIKTGLILGLGKVTITATAVCAEGQSTTKTAIGTVFLFFVMGVKEG